ncbi:hypothetical protein F4780DRAFT_184683 [Xylariomycetidae sp. FL0641]|nr:hypothetical protein F4780DRAFT_184683 [Xylariomycetidae sp. FL0641]
MSDISKEEEKPASTAKEGVAGTKEATPASRQGHFKRFWWLDLLLLLLVATIIIVPCVVLVAVPAMAQSRLDSVSLSIDGISVTDTRADSLTLSINATIGASGGVQAKVDAFKGTIYLAGAKPPRPFAQLQFPETTSGGAQTLNVSQNMPIDQVSAFTDFSMQLLAQESVSVTLAGDTHVHVAGIARAFPVAFKKTISLPGLNGFAGLSISDPQVSVTSKDNFNGTVHLPNPSGLTLEVGNITFTTYLNGTNAGLGYLDNVLLVPGDNAFPMQASINTMVVAQALTSPGYCKDNGVLPFALRASRVTNHGKELPYFEKALGAVNASISIDTGIHIGCIDLGT